MTKILGIETSCDDTSAAVVENGITILSNVVAGQEQYHRKFVVLCRRSPPENIWNTCTSNRSTLPG